MNFGNHFTHDKQSPRIQEKLKCLNRSFLYLATCLILRALPPIESNAAARIVSSRERPEADPPRKSSGTSHLFEKAVRVLLFVRKCMIGMLHYCKF